MVVCLGKESYETPLFYTRAAGQYASSIWRLAAQVLDAGASETIEVRARGSPKLERAPEAPRVVGADGAPTTLTRGANTGCSTERSLESTGNTQLVQRQRS